MDKSINFMSESEKDFLIASYDSLEFMDDVSGLKCTRCERVAIAHYHSNCDHLFCKNCKTILNMEVLNRWICPKCKKTINHISVQKFETENVISNLRANCLNKKYGCDLVLQLSKIPDHYKVCRNTKERVLPMEMTEDATDGVLLRLDSINHRIDSLADIVIGNQSELETKCIQLLEYRNKDRDMKIENKIDRIQRSIDELRSDIHVEIEQVASSIDKKITDTINSKMEEWMQLLTTSFAEQGSNSHEQIDGSKINIPLRIASDLYAIEMRKTLNEMVVKQNEAKNHVDGGFKAVTEALEDVKREIKSLKSDSVKDNIQPNLRRRSSTVKRSSRENLSNAPNVEISKTDVVLQSALRELTKARTSTVDSQLLDRGFKWEISNFKEKLSETITLHSPVFSINGYPFSCQAKLEHSYRNGIYLAICFKDLSNTETALELKCLPRVTYILLCSSTQSVEKTTRVRVKDYLLREKNVDAFDQFYFDELMGYKSNLLPGRSTQKITGQIFVSVTSPALDQPLSRNGTLVWTINNFQKKRQLVKDEVMLSVQGPGYFYTDEPGYRVKCELSWDQLNNVYVRISFVTGEFDSDLPSAFYHKTTVTLFDQLNHKHFETGVVKDIKLSKWYNVDIMSSASIVHGNYLKGGSLLMKIAIEAQK